MNNLQLKDFINYNFISQLKVSPDEKYSAFVVAKSNYEDNGYDKNIYLLNNETKEISRLTTMNKEGSFIWLANDTILFQSNRSEEIKREIETGANWSLFYSINIHGGEAEEFMRIPYDVSDIKKIADNKFAMLIEHKGNKININEFSGQERVQAEKKYKEELDYEVLEEIPFWANGASFDSGFRDRLAICEIITADEFHIDFVTDRKTFIDSFEIKDNKILYVANTYENKMDVFNSLNIYDLVSKEITELYPQGDMSIENAFFLEDEIVVLATDMKEFGLNENKNFYIVKDKKMNLLTEHDARFGSSVGSDVKLGGGIIQKVYKNKLYFINTIQYGSFLNSLDIEGNIEILTTYNGSVDMFDITEKEILFVGLRDYKLQEIYSINNYSQDEEDEDEDIEKKENKITSLNDEVLADKKISKPEYFKFMNSDRMHIDGWVIKPVDFDENKKYPCILDIHGGPKTVYGEVFFHEMQVWANQGYFVIFSNPRGGDGRGNLFMDIRGKYGTIDYEDLMEFTDECIERYPQIDIEKLGVTGGSYGGYMTNWIIGHTDRFKCAASQRSISNWISKFGTTDIGYFFNSDQNQSTPWENHDKLWWHSPLKYADKCTTPTLFIHSECDYRCWLAEGLQMFTALKYHGVDARLCMFRDENHDLSRSGKPKHRERRLSEITNWFEKYLK